ncbi:MAG: hypothetical protein ACRCTD_00630 [Beijerinckiaceae bacterium]
MNKIILSGIAALALAASAQASESAGNNAQDKADLFNAQRGIITQPVQHRGGVGARSDLRTVERAVANAPAPAEREASQQ